ncbi:hypothetical protein B0T13DRAFT_529523 [Neurospora crassa]|nr:hypothetical protein B0T13DRAFT_529523 [Neurospora crassa]
MGFDIGCVDVCATAWHDYFAVFGLTDSIVESIGMLEAELGMVIHLQHCRGHLAARRRHQTLTAVVPCKLVEQLTYRRNFDFQDIPSPYRDDRGRHDVGYLNIAIMAGIDESGSKRHVDEKREGEQKRESSSSSPVYRRPLKIPKGICSCIALKIKTLGIVETTSQSRYTPNKSPVASRQLGSWWWVKNSSSLRFARSVAREDEVDWGETPQSTFYFPMVMCIEIPEGSKGVVARPEWRPVRSELGTSVDDKKKKKKKKKNKAWELLRLASSWCFTAVGSPR